MIKNEKFEFLNSTNKTNKTNKSRKVVQYGYEYDRSGLTKIEKPIPEIYREIVDKTRINTLIGTDLIKSDQDQIIINEYLPGQGISPHTDHERMFISK